MSSVINQDELNEFMKKGWSYPTATGGGGKGEKGDPGVSPVVKVTETDTGHEITITDANGDTKFEVLNGIDAKADELFPVVIEGSIASHADGTQTTVKKALSDRGFYLVALHCTNIPRDGYYFLEHQGQSMELHRIVGDDLYSNVTVAFEQYNNVYANYITFYSNDASAMNYKVYKLPFFAE